MTTAGVQYQLTFPIKPRDGSRVYCSPRLSQAQYDDLTRLVKERMAGVAPTFVFRFYGFDGSDGWLCFMDCSRPSSQSHVHLYIEPLKLEYGGQHWSWYWSEADYAHVIRGNQGLLDTFIECVETTAQLLTLQFRLMGL